MRIMAAICLGLLAAMIAHEAGVPWWREWEIGDASDIGLISALFFFYASRIKP